MGSITTPYEVFNYVIAVHDPSRAAAGEMVVSELSVEQSFDLDRSGFRLTRTHSTHGSLPSNATVINVQKDHGCLMLNPFSHHLPGKLSRHLVDLVMGSLSSAWSQFQGSERFAQIVALERAKDTRGGGNKRVRSEGSGASSDAIVNPTAASSSSRSAAVTGDGSGPGRGRPRA